MGFCRDVSSADDVGVTGVIAGDTSKQLSRAAAPIVLTEATARRCASDIQDRNRAIMVLSTPVGLFPYLQILFAEGAYRGPLFNGALEKALPHLRAEIVERFGRVKGLCRPTETLDR